MRRILAVLALMAAAFIVAPATAANAATVYYRIVNRESGECLNQDFSGGTAHSDVLAWPCSSPTAVPHNEEWQINDSGEIVNRATGKCLNQDYSGGEQHDVIVYTCSTDYYNGLWFETADPDSSGYEMIQNFLSQWYLNQDYSGGVSHHDVLAWPSSTYPAADNSEWFAIAQP